MAGGDICLLAIRFAATTGGRAGCAAGQRGRDRSTGRPRRRHREGSGRRDGRRRPRAEKRTDVSAAGRKAGDGSGGADVRSRAAARANEPAGGVPQQRRHAAQRPRDPRRDARGRVQRRDPDRRLLQPYVRARRLLSRRLRHPSGDGRVGVRRLVALHRRRRRQWKLLVRRSARRRVDGHGLC